MKTIVTFIFTLFLGLTVQAQIRLDNPSFEGEPLDATTPTGWQPCAKGTTPDILPGYWGVHNEPSEGDTFVGLISRADGSTESIGQRTSAPMKAGECYKISVDVAHSKTYSGYNKTLKLRVWVGTRKCRQSLLIGETKLIEEEDWETYNFSFTPEKDMNYIIIEAYFSDDDFSREGNILIDNISVIKKCNRA